MDIQDLIEETKELLRKQRMVNSDQLTLGELISKVERIANNMEEDPLVYYDFGGFSTSDIASWRGSYGELALNYTKDSDIRASGFLELLRSAIGQRFYGYKGGTFQMNEDTPIWVSNWGQYCSTAVTDVLDMEYQIILVTGYRGY